MAGTDCGIGPRVAHPEDLLGEAGCDGRRRGAGDRRALEAMKRRRLAGPIRQKSHHG